MKSHSRRGKEASSWRTHKLWSFITYGPVPKYTSGFIRPEMCRGEAVGIWVTDLLAP